MKKLLFLFAMLILTVSVSFGQVRHRHHRHHMMHHHHVVHHPVHPVHH
jgi:hypothetical protein